MSMIAGPKEPPIEMLKTRAAGSTTFVQCGWCEHHGSGSYHYDAMLEGNCDLLRYNVDGKDRRWDSPCDVVKLGAADVQRLIASHRYEITARLKANKRSEGYIGVLEALTPSARPVLPELRDAEHFNVGDPCYVYYEGRWQHGTVAMGYRHHDGCVSYVLDDVPESATKGPWGCGVQVPGCIRGDEYDYFREHTEEFRAWLDQSDRDYNGDRLPLDAYFTALVSAP